MTETEALVAIGKRLQKMRKAAGFTSALAFADYAGIGQSAYTSYEQGRSNMNLLVAAKIADALRCSIDELVGRDLMCDDPKQRLIDEADRALIWSYHHIDERGREIIDAVIKIQGTQEDSKHSLGENEVQAGLMEA